MQTPNTITLEDIFEYKPRVKFTEAEENAKACLSHYLNKDVEEERAVYKQGALQFIQKFYTVKYKKTAETISVTEAEEILKQLDEQYKVKEYPFPKRKSEFLFIDLFAGGGGFRLGLQEHGGECVFSSEWNIAAKHTYAHNFGEYPFGDITSEQTKKFIPEKFDILCGGFPCQAFSVAGRREGFNDTRGTLFFDIEKIIEKHRPKAFFLENVKNLQGHDKGRTFKIMLQTLEEKLGYKVFYKVLNSMEFANVPQNRERIFIVGFNPDKVMGYEEFTFPDSEALTANVQSTLIAGKKEEKYYYKKEHQYYPKLEEAMQSKTTVYQWRRVYVRENKSNVCPTLTANMGAGGHNVPLVIDDYGIRKLTPKECFNFQGYPQDYLLPKTQSDSKLYMQAGNSVTVPLIKKIANEIVKIIDL